MEDIHENCPSCSAPRHPSSGKYPILKLEDIEKKSQIIQAPEKKVAVAHTSGSLLKTTGSFKTPGSTWPKREQLWRIVLLREVTPRLFLVCILAVAVLLGSGTAGLYIYRRLTLNIKVPQQVLEQYPTVKALKIVQEFPSTTKGLSIYQRVDQFIKEQKLKNYHWWSAPDKTSGQYAVLFIFIKDKEEQTAVWLVDIEKRSFKADNKLALSFSGL